MSMHEDVLGMIRLGTLAVRHGYLTPERLEYVLRVQEAMRRPKPLGELLVERGYLKKPEVTFLLQCQTQLVRELDPDVRRYYEAERQALSALHAGLIDRSELEFALRAFEFSNQSMPSILQTMVEIGLLTEEDAASLPPLKEHVAMRCLNCRIRYSLAIPLGRSVVPCPQCSQPLVEVRPEKPPFSSSATAPATVADHSGEARPSAPPSVESPSSPQPTPAPAASAPPLPPTPAPTPRPVEKKKVKPEFKWIDFSSIPPDAGEQSPEPGPVPKESVSGSRSRAPGPLPVGEPQSAAAPGAADPGVFEQVGEMLEMAETRLLRQNHAKAESNGESAPGSSRPMKCGRCGKTYLVRFHASSATPVCPQCGIAMQAVQIGAYTTLTSAAPAPLPRSSGKRVDLQAVQKAAQETAIRLRPVQATKRTAKCILCDHSFLALPDADDRVTCPQCQTSFTVL